MRVFFAGKVVYSNCDAPYESNFFKYFVENFYKLKLKCFICTCYKTSPVAGDEVDTSPLFCKEPKERVCRYKIILTKEKMKEIFENKTDIKLEQIKNLLENEKTQGKYIELLQGDGDFASEECVELLKISDIVVTNPPFSLIRKYIPLVLENNKDFLIIGPESTIGYKEIFPLIKDEKIKFGVNWVKKFVVCSYEKEKEYRKFGNILWFTTLKHKFENELLITKNKYFGNEELYKKYDNYDAIDVVPYTKIPVDYNGVMGLPISFLPKMNFDQFELVKFRKGNDGKDLRINGKDCFTRILIKRKVNYDDLFIQEYNEMIRRNNLFIKHLISFNETQEDKNEKENQNAKNTNDIISNIETNSRKMEIEVRYGQGKIRDNVLQREKCKCQLCDICIKEL